MFYKELLKLGLTKGEAEIYDCLMQIGEASARDISKRTNIGRTNIYEYSHLLMKRGLISQYERNGKIFFRPEDPVGLKDMLEQRVREVRELSSAFDDLFPKLNEAFSKSVSRPVIRFLHGESGYEELMQKVYLDSETDQLLMLIGDLDLYEPPEPKYHSAVLRKQLFTTILTNKGNSLVEFNKRDARELRETKLVSQEIFPITTDMLVFENVVYFGNLTKKAFSVTMVKNSQFVYMLRALIANALK